MEKRLLSEIDEQIEEGNEILIEGHTIFDIPESVGKYIEQYTDLKVLGFIGCKLKSLKNLPVMENLRELNLEEN